MINKKNIITAAALVIFMTGFTAATATAETSNNLLQMDVKRSSVADTVDVTFYTTGDMSNSVVTRKANNRYVVLLPNVGSSASVAPGFGAVKDLITDIDVKHVNDGIGGYTKVTFATTKPVNIKTHMKKTQPLTQAQKDYKAILAQNNTSKTKAVQPANQNIKPVSNTTAKNTAAKPAPAVQKTAQKPASAAPKLALVEIPKQAVKSIIKPNVVKPAAPVKAQSPVKPVAKTVVKPVVQPNIEDSNGYVPKMKFDANGKRVLDLEPRVSHKIVTETKPSEPVVSDPVLNVNQPETPVADAVQPQAEETAVETPESNSASNFPYWILIAGGSVLTLGILYLVFDAVRHSSDKDKTRLQSFFKMSSQNMAKRRRREYYDIVNNDELNWQEKYKLYTEKETKRKVKKEPMDMSYVTDLAGTKQALVEPKQDKKIPEVKTEVQKEDFKKKFNEKMQAKISQMEHALAQTPSVKEPEFETNEVKSEDNMIINKISDVKLKSFSKPITLKATSRTLAQTEKKVSRNKSYQEGRFVKLKNSPLSVSRRNSASNELEVTDLIGTGNKYLTNNNNGEMKMNKENENYLLSSLDEYLSILDEEAERKATPAGSLAQLKSPSAQAMTRSGVTNPIAHNSNPVKQPVPYMNGLIVKSGYNIDSERGFYLVNIDGVSALVGRIKDNVFILKKFDHVIDKPIQVRPDDGSVYIVKVGKYKCLVDVSKDKMGTLIEI